MIHAGVAAVSLVVFVFLAAAFQVRKGRVDSACQDLGLVHVRV
jgi:hypothetical protein